MTKEKTFNQMAKESGISASTIRGRYRKGVRGAALVAPPRKVPQRPHRFNKVDDNGETLHEISEKTGVPVKTLYSRYARGERGNMLRRPLRTKDMYLGQFTVNDLTRLVNKYRPDHAQVEMHNIGSFLRYRRKERGLTEAQAVMELLDWYNVELR